MTITPGRCLTVALIRHAHRCRLPYRCEPAPRVACRAVRAAVVHRVEVRKVYVSATPQAHKPCLPFEIGGEVGAMLDATA